MRRGDCGGCTEGERGVASSGICGAVLLEDYAEAYALHVEAGRFSRGGDSGPADAGAEDLVSDPGAGAGRAVAHQSLSVWVQEGR